VGDAAAASIAASSRHAAATSDHGHEGRLLGILAATAQGLPSNKDEMTGTDTAAGAPHAAAARPLRLLIADDHEMVRIAMRVALAGLAPQILWFDAGDAQRVAELLASEPDIDVALIDLTMPGAIGTGWIAQLRQRFPTVPLIVMSASEDPAVIRELIDLGVAGFIPKSDQAEVIAQAVRLVLAGGTYAPLRLLSAGPAGKVSQPQAAAGLTPRQVDVLRALARGLSNKMIARELGLSEGTVKAHLLAVFRVLRARNRTEAVVTAQQWLRADA
jgi:DNA-binding NarL/FixJ family response regulator